MACYQPIVAYRSRYPDASGKFPVVFDISDAWSDRQIKIPCGNCIGCRLDRAKAWAIRCMHESSMHDDNSFITLTYDDVHLPKNGSLDHRDFQLFMKKLRREIAPKKIRFFQCGEYGSKMKRPHYHALIFGLDFRDDMCYSNIATKLFSSKLLERCWDKGFNLVGNLTFESASYVTGYILKKVNDRDSLTRYNPVSFVTGEIIYLRPEYITMSRRPGIGSNWFDKFKKEVYNNDEVIIRGGKMRPPRYYDKKFKLSNPDDWELIAKKRQSQPKNVLENSTDERLKVREVVALASLKLKSRSYENGQ